MIHEYDEGYGERMDEEVRAAYEAGCRKGYEKAMREQGMMGERRMPGYFPEYPRMDEMGERRRRRANGEFY